MSDTAAARPSLVRRGLWLNYLTLTYNTLEAIVSIAAGLAAASVALLGFGVDSGIEVTASVAAQWRLRADLDAARRERVERVTHRLIGASFLVLAAYVAVDSATTLWKREAPEASTVGLVILVLSVLVMPLLARAKQRVARALRSRALEADAAQTSLCAYLSVIALVGWDSMRHSVGGGRIRRRHSSWCRSSQARDSRGCGATPVLSSSLDRLLPHPYARIMFRRVASVLLLLGFLLAMAPMPGGGMGCGSMAEPVLYYAWSSAFSMVPSDSVSTSEWQPAALRHKSTRAHAARFAAVSK